MSRSRDDGAVRVAISEEQLAALLDRWEGQPVAVRVVAPGHELLAVFRGRLGRRSTEKRPSLFWPLACAGAPPGAEEPGIYLHPGLVEEAAEHPGDVVEWRQASVTLSVRRL
jgi:hypothetical protein